MKESLNVFARLPQWQVLEIKGPDAQDFLHRLTSANFKQLKPGFFTPGTLLTPTGKIALYFKALLLEPGHYYLLVPSPEAGVSGAQTALDAFEKMHFRENFTLTNLAADWAYLRLLASDEKRITRLEPLIPPTGQIKQTKDGRLILNEGRWCTDPFKLDLGLLVPQPRLAGVTLTLRQSEFDEAPTLEPYRLRAGDPAVPAELNSTTIPLEARLDDAVHENKGCYPGQEVVERIRAMGQVPRGLARITGQGETPAVPGTLTSGDQEAGSLTSAIADPIAGGWVGLGYLKRTFAKNVAATYVVGQQPVSVQLK